jgi:hypothetical protein
MLELARRHPQDPTSFDALAWVAILGDNTIECHVAAEALARRPLADQAVSPPDEPLYPEMQIGFHLARATADERGPHQHSLRSAEPMYDRDPDGGLRVLDDV